MTTLDNNNYWINKNNCYWNALYHTKHHKDKKNNIQRLGAVYYKGVALEGDGNELDISAKKFYRGAGHTWTETKDDYIIDWVINNTLNISSNEKVKWSKEELKELGFEYKYYKNEKGIKKKVEEGLNCSCKTNKEWEQCSIDWAREYWKQFDI